MLVIDPDECIDCGVCVPECPAEAIYADTDSQATPEWLALNEKYASQWPNILVKKEPLDTADKLDGAEDKLTKFFSPNPGAG